MFTHNLIVNSSANIFPEESGSSTEVAMLKFMNRAGFDITAIREKTTII